jgi:putative lumazine-binding protein
MHHNYAAVIELLDKYYDGLYYGDTALLREVFHPDARYVTVSGGELLQLDMASYFPIVEARSSPQQLGEPYGFQVDSLEFAGPATALARVRSSMLGKDFIDLLAMIQLDGAWRIIAKVFHYDQRSQLAKISEPAMERST